MTRYAKENSRGPDTTMSRTDRQQEASFRTSQRGAADPDSGSLACSDTRLSSDELQRFGNDPLATFRANLASVEDRIRSEEHTSELQSH